MTHTLLTRRRFGVALAVASLALVAACGGASAPAASSAGGNTTDHNDADIAFATDMIPHHAQAVEMADMALSTSKNTEIVALATSIKGAQEPEIQTMTGFLRDWKAPIPATGGGMAGHSSGMSSMMSDSEMADLGKAMGTAFDTLWLDMMTRHHEGAIEMSKTELAQGASADAKTLAQQIIAAQTTEIATMKRIKVA